MLLFFSFSVAEIHQDASIHMITNIIVTEKIRLLTFNIMFMVEKKLLFMEYILNVQI